MSAVIIRVSVTEFNITVGVNSGFIKVEIVVVYAAWFIPYTEAGGAAAGIQDIVF
jgi:hypothetical protein